MTSKEHCYIEVEIFGVQETKYFYNEEKSVFMGPGMILVCACISWVKENLVCASLQKQITINVTYILYDAKLNKFF